jgi:translation initiation factor 3 subunit B
LCFDYDLLFYYLGSDDEDVYQEEQMDFDYGLGNTIVVDNLPVVPKEKFDKLEGVVRKIYSQIGVIKEDGLWMPVDPGTHKTLGYCFIEYNTPQVLSICMSVCIYFHFLEFSDDC